MNKLFSNNNLKDWFKKNKEILATSFIEGIVGICLMGFFALSPNKFWTVVSLLGIVCYLFILFYLNKVETEVEMNKELVDVLEKSNSNINFEIKALKEGIDVANATLDDIQMTVKNFTKS